MSSYLTLLRLSVLNTLAALRAAMTGKSSGKIGVGAIILTVICVGALAVTAGFLIWAEVTLFGILAGMGQAMLLPALAILVCMALTLFMGLFHTLGRLYFSRDSAWLSSLPITSRTVMAARLTEVYLSETLINLLILLPLFICLGIHRGGGAGYWLTALATLFLTTALPMAVITLLASLLARLSVLSRHKELLITLGSMVLVVAVLVLQMSLTPRIPDDAGAMFFVQLLMDQNGLVNVLTSSIPPVRWAVEGLMGSGVSFLLFALVSLGSLAAVVFLLGGRYLDVCIRQSEQATRRKARRLNRSDWKVSGQGWALFRREWSELCRTPAYVTNGLSGVIIMPIILIMGMVSAAAALEMPVMELVRMAQGWIGQIHPADLTMLLAGMMAFCCWINPAVSTAVTREGRHHDLYRMMPVTPRALLRAKLMTGLVINGLAMLVVTAICAVLLGAMVWTLAPALALATLVSYATCALSLALDAVRPNYDWATETQAIKSSVNSVISMGVNTLFLALPVAGWFLLMLNTDWSPMARAAAVTAFLALLTALGAWLLRGPGERAYAGSEG